MISGSLIIWLSGVVFLFCCGAPPANAANVESCPLAKKNHCSKQTKIKTISGFASVEREPQMLECCKILPLVFDKARKIEKSQKISAAKTNLKIVQPFIAVENLRFAAPKNFHSVATYRKYIYLKNCVFRI